MGDSLSKIIALIIAALILFIFPTKNELERQDDISRMYVLTETTRFVDSIRNLGYITPVMYGEFVNSLSVTGNSYNIKMEWYHKNLDPNYDPVTGDFEDSFQANYTAKYTDDIMDDLSTGTTYSMSKGDYFLVKVSNRNKTLATKVQEMIYNAKFATERIVVCYGGMIKDESY